MEKNKRRNTTSDDLAIVKAAAWAWYEHGSGSEGKLMREYDATTNLLRPHNKPSRYKIEAMKNMIQQPNYSTSTTTPIHDHEREYSKHHSLLDSYEVESISKQLDYLILSSSNRFDRFDNKDRKDVDLPKSNKLVKKNQNQKKSLLKGLWSRHSVVCGTRDDVVSRALVRTRPLPITTGRRVPRGTIPRPGDG
ncbi:hypothetical protein M5689_007090 [Euphorbia peplus]|nr:hypothetical protein M5689_007090 [Euphorbia peplus]